MAIYKQFTIPYMKNQVDEALKVYEYVSRTWGGSELKIMTVSILTGLLMVRDVILKAKRDNKNAKMAN